MQSGLALVQWGPALVPIQALPLLGPALVHLPVHNAHRLCNPALFAHRGSLVMHFSI